MASLNKVIMIGHLVADPELKQTQSGISVTSFRIGVTRRFTKQGEQPVSDFFDVVAWRSTAEFVTRFFRKGRPICVVGSLQNRQWTDKDGNKRTTAEIQADECSFVDSSRDAANNGGSTQLPPFSANTEPAGNPPAYASNDSAPSKFEELSNDDDLPF